MQGQKTLDDWGFRPASRIKRKKPPIDDAPDAPNSQSNAVLTPPPAVPTTTTTHSNNTTLTTTATTTTNNTKKTKLTLSTQQRRVLDLVVKEGRSVFFTGAAGTGKSFLLQAIIEGIKRKRGFKPWDLCVTASTGIAACSIGGTTVHSFAGMGLMSGTKEVLLKKLRSNRMAIRRWQSVRTLIVDEVSMVDGDMFDLLDWIARQIRNFDAPFGGIQVVLCGDFFQLPPVPNKGQPDKPFCFEAKQWKYVVPDTILLTEDEEFVNILNQMRMNKLTSESINTLATLNRPLQFNDGIVPTELYPRRHQVDSANYSRLTGLEGPAFKFDCIDDLSRPDQMLQKRLADHCIASDNLVLKVGAQVMLLFNMDIQLGLINGSLGIVESFDKDDDNLPMVRFVDPPIVMKIRPHVWSIEELGKIVATRTQIPLLLAWAMSIHKAQGQTIQRLKVDLAKTFEKGQAYVALSRAVSLQGLQVSGFRPDIVKTDRKVVGQSISVV